ncbi:MAG TPA: tRNA-dihydrouridine synthase, partial [Xanthobacteraceae bacterium]
LKATHPRLTVVLNGGVGDLDEARAHLARVDGVMMGRAAYQEPWRLLAVDQMMFGEDAAFASPHAAAAALVPYIERELARGTRLHAITRHLHGLFRAVPGARAFRRELASAAARPGAGSDFLLKALALVSDNDLDSGRAAA